MNHDLLKVHEALEAVVDLLRGDPELALEYADHHDIETKKWDDDYRLRGDHHDDARYHYPAQQKLAQDVLEDQMGKLERAGIFENHESDGRHYL